MLLLHLGIIEVTQNTLHSLEAVDYPIEITAVVQRARCIDHVTQFLRLDPHLVDCLYWGLVMDRHGAIDQAPMDMQDPPRGYLQQWTSCVRGFAGSRRLLQKRPPACKQVSIAVTFENPLQQAVCVQLLSAEESGEICQIAARKAFG